MLYGLSVLLSQFCSACSPSRLLTVTTKRKNKMKAKIFVNSLGEKKLPEKNALRKKLWVIVLIKACCLFLLWFFFVRPYATPVNNAAFTQHVTTSSEVTSMSSKY